jgi:FkbM family methyltransferase
MGQFITYAQNNEDVILDAYFSDVTKGTYVDIGANHPVHDSVTKHFYNKGWRGVNIEPVKHLYELLVADRPHDINIHAGVSNTPGTLTLRQYKNKGLSTFSDEIKKEHAKHPEGKTESYADVAVPTVTLTDLLAEHKIGHVHFMKIDVEGFEYNVLKGNDWKKFRPEIICIEASRSLPGKDWRDILHKNGYEQVWHDGLNEYYLAKESAKRKTKFNYAEALLLGDQVLPYHVVNRIQELERQLHDEQIKLEVQAIRIKKLEDDNKRAQKEIIDQKRFKNATKLMVKAIDNVVTARIEHLGVARKRAALSIDAKASESYNASSKEALLASIRQNDMATYYSVQPPRKQQKFYAYKVVMGSYKLAKKAVITPLKIAHAAVKKKDTQHDDQ